MKVATTAFVQSGDSLSATLLAVFDLCPWMLVNMKGVTQSAEEVESVERFPAVLVCSACCACVGVPVSQVFISWISLYTGQRQ